MLMWVVLAWLPAAVAAVAATWAWGGQPWIKAAAAGAGIALLVVLGSGVLVVRALAHSASRAAFVFVSGSIFRLLVAGGLALGAWWAWALEPTPLIASVLAGYLGAWGGQCFWLLRAIRRTTAGAAPPDPRSQT